ncbi:endo-1,4-beta-xylanase [Bradyrhizobium sp.]|uniref:endo-1,4-beta-xylanase n=1 Tax=Bradyrhizobium sp. TaxID=376 RepID=UPI003C1D152E
MLIERRTRRDFLAGAAKAAVLGLSGTTVLSGVSAFATPPIEPPASAAEKLIPYGAAVRSDALASDLTYRAAMAANCQIIVPESELKWTELRPTRDQYRFEKADAILDFARLNGIDVRGHTLAWSGAMPAWTDAIATPVEAERELVDHIQTVVGRYRGAVQCWDVVNEPLAHWPEDDASFRPSIWASRLRGNYLPIALRATAAADPGARLVLNEYDLEFSGPRFMARRHALIRLLRTLRDRDVPLHAVGLQAHLFADRAIDRDGLQTLLAEIAKLKLDVLITQLDVIDYELPGKVSERDAQVASLAAGFLKTVCEVACPKAIVTWGLSDRYSWVPTYFKRPDGLPNRPLPLDADLRPKPLYDVIEEFRRKAA